LRACKSFNGKKNLRKIEPNGRRNLIRSNVKKEVFSRSLKKELTSWNKPRIKPLPSKPGEIEKGKGFGEILGNKSFKPLLEIFGIKNGINPGLENPTFSKPERCQRI